MFLWERNYGLWEERLCPQEDGELLSLPFWPRKLVIKWRAEEEEN